MTISPIGYQPYIYNTNAISSASMNKISAIPDDALASKIDFGKSRENENPLKPGQSSNFADILVSQMSMSQMNATRVMNTSGQMEVAADEKAAENLVIGAADDNLKAELTMPKVENDENATMNNQNSGNGPSLYQRMSAANAYMVNMFA